VEILDVVDPASIAPNLTQLARQNVLPVVISEQFKREVEERPRVPAGNPWGGQFSKE
jgi:hypothetical protein